MSWRRSAEEFFEISSVSVGADSQSYLWRAIMLGMKLLVYSAAWCRDCYVAKRFLETHNIPYEEVDIEETPGAADEVLRHVGKRAIPQFVIDGEWVQPYRPGRGFLFEEMSEKLGITNKA